MEKHATLKTFNVRVYSVIINEKNQVLLSDEFRLNRTMTKFPGGGLELGEGTLDCLHREAMEEFGQDIKVIEHFYTTDFFQKTFHRDDQQLLSIYYLVSFVEPPRFKISETKFDLPGVMDENQSFRWQSIKDWDTEEVTFPIDRHAAQLLKQKFV